MLRALIGALAWCARLLPARLAAGLGCALGWCWYRLVPVRRGVARRNVAAALGLPPAGRERVVRQMYLHLGQCLVELLRFGPDAVDVTTHTDDEGRRRLAAAVGEGRGVLVLSAHLGNFEVLVRGATAAGRRITVITKTFRSRLAEGAWRSLRRGGARLVTPGGSARAVLEALGRGEIVAYVLDQHVPPGRAVWVPFFGRPAATSPDLARLARLSGAPVLPVFTWRGPGGHVVEVGEPVPMPRTADRAADVVEGTRRCAAVVEAAIRRHPEQWLWIHRRWKPPPPDVAAVLTERGVAGRRRPRQRSAVSRPPGRAVDP